MTPTELYLAKSLSVLSERLSMLGLREEASRATKEADAIYDRADGSTVGVQHTERSLSDEPQLPGSIELELLAGDMVGLALMSGAIVSGAVGSFDDVRSADASSSAGAETLRAWLRALERFATHSRAPALGAASPPLADRGAPDIRAIAAETFGSRERADLWLERPNAAFWQLAPADLLKTREGTEQVRILLGRIAHGIAA